MISHCTECESVEGKVNGKLTEGGVIDVCGECDGENTIEYLPEDDPRDER